jgi:hypothetical protein
VLSEDVAELPESLIARMGVKPLQEPTANALVTDEIKRRLGGISKMHWLSDFGKAHLLKAR